MSEARSFWICGRKMVLPASPEPVEKLLQKKGKKGAKKGKKKQTQEPVSLKRKRYRLRKKQK